MKRRKKENTFYDFFGSIGFAQQVEKNGFFGNKKLS